LSSDWSGFNWHVKVVSSSLTGSSFFANLDNFPFCFPCLFFAAAK
jgi:hypothetical protein